MHILSTLNLSDITSKLRTVAMFTTTDIDISHQISRNVYMSIFIEDFIPPVPTIHYLLVYNWKLNINFRTAAILFHILLKKHHVYEICKLVKNILLYNISGAYV
jgi:hypothetical protein